MPAPKKNTKPAVKVDEPTVDDTEVLTAEQEREARAERDEALAGMPELRPAHRFRLTHKNSFQTLSLEAIKSGAFDTIKSIRNGDKTYSPIENAEKLLAIRAFLGKVDEWAESIAVNPADYAAWAEALEEPETTFMALFAKYQEDLGE